MRTDLDQLFRLYKDKLDDYKRKHHYYVMYRCILLTLFIVLIIAGMKIPAIHSYLMIFFVLLIIVFVCVCIKHHRVKNKKEYYEIFLEVINEYYKRINNQWNEFKDTGKDFINKDNYILLDLDIIGDNSLFQYLNIGKSEGGRRKLIERLSNPHIENLFYEQQAVEELSKKLELVIQIQCGLRKIKGDLTEQIKILNKKRKNHKVEFIIHSLFSAVTLSLAVLSLFNIINSAYFSMSAILQLSFSLIIDKMNNEDFYDIKISSSSFACIHPLFKLINEQSFSSEKMNDIKRNINKGEVIISKLNQIFDLNTFRNQFLGYILSNSLFPLNGYLLYSFYNVTNYSFDDLNHSIHCFEDLESLISLSVMGVCKNDISMPKLANKIELSFCDIKHPLLNERDCISNSFSCKNHINIITGSNMSGKTSFMRTIGMNMILMNAGGFVNASSFEAPYLKIFTSMRIQDDIDKGISTFYGELLRIKDIIEFKNENIPFIVFIDEIFKGTNYNDRIFGAKEIIKNIAQNNSILFISTHDFELCDIENCLLHNYYFEEYYEDNKIKFDYKIKEGKCKTTNARFLMKQLDII